MTSQDTPGEIVDRENLAVQPLSDEDLTAVIETVMSSPKGQDVVTQLVGLKDAGAKGDKKRKGLKSFLVGATMRELKGRVQAPTVEEMVDRILVNKGA